MPLTKEFVAQARTLPRTFMWRGMNLLIGIKKFSGVGRSQDLWVLSDALGGFSDSLHVLEALLSFLEVPGGFL